MTRPVVLTSKLRVPSSANQIKGPFKENGSACILQMETKSKIRDQLPLGLLEKSKNADSEPRFSFGFCFQKSS